MNAINSNNTTTDRGTQTPNTTTDRGTQTENEKYTAPDIELSIDNTLVKEELIRDIKRLSIEQSIHLPSICTITFENSYESGRPEDEPWKHSGLLEIGNRIDVSLTNSTTKEFSEHRSDKLFYGEIVGQNCHFENSQASITIIAHDISHRLHRGRHSDSFLDDTDSDIVSKIAKKVGIEEGRIVDRGLVHDYVFQENQTNMEFLRERAFLNGNQLYVKDNKLNFCPPNPEAVLNFNWKTDIESFSVRVSSAEQVDSVEVRGWDYNRKLPISGIAREGKVLTENQFSSGQESQTSGQKSQTSSGQESQTSGQKSQNTCKVTVVDRPVFSVREANNIAQAVCDRLAGNYICADATVSGNPDIQVGKIVKLSNMGKYSGKYYITETRHIHHKQGAYKTYFSVRGLKGGNLLELLSPPRNLKPAETLLVGKVTAIADPKNLGRVKVKFPTLTQNHDSNWARVVGVGAGKDRGFYCLPELNDEVLVGFEHGDIRRPYVLGGVWNGKDFPPASVQNSVVRNKVRLRTIKTRVGHIFQFVEEDKGKSKKGVYLRTAGGNRVNFNDSQGKIEIRTKSGHKIVMDDKNSTINIESTGSLNIQAKKDIDIKAKGDIKLEGRQIHLN